MFVLLEDTIRRLSANSVLASTDGTSRAALDKISYVFTSSPRSKTEN